MALVDILFCVDWHLVCDRKTIEYQLLGLYNSVNFTGKEPDEKQLFLHVPIPAPIPVFLQFQLPMIYKASYFTEWLLCNINLSSAFKLFYSLENARHVTHCNMYIPTNTVLLVSFPMCKFSQMVSYSFSRNFSDSEIHKPYY